MEKYERLDQLRPVLTMDARGARREFVLEVQVVGSDMIVEDRRWRLKLGTPEVKRRTGKIVLHHLCRDGFSKRIPIPQDCGRKPWGRNANKVAEWLGRLVSPHISLRGSKTLVYVCEQIYALHAVDSVMST